MFGINIGVRRRVSLRHVVILLGLLVQIGGLMLPSPAMAQQNNRGGSPYKLLGPYNETSYYSTVAQAVAAGEAAITAYNTAHSPNWTPTCSFKISPFNPDVASLTGSVATVSLPCSGIFGATSTIYWKTYSFDVGKNAGGCDCDGGNGHSGGTKPGSALKHDPINTATGNKFEQETDYAAPNGWLTFRRFYNSLASINATTMGTMWRHSFDRSLQVLSSTAINLYRPDGRFELFQKASSVWTADADVADILTEQDNPSGQPLGYTVLIAATRQTEQYSPAGLLLSITDPSGAVTTLTYSTAATPVAVASQPNLLLTVTDPSNRTLNLTYNSGGQLQTLTLPDSGVLTYGYDLNGNLTSVQYPDGKTRQLIYNEPSLTSGANLTGALTGEIDEAANRYASTTYDSAGRAIAVTLAGGVEAASISYAVGGSASSTVTTPLGATSSLNFQNTLGALKVNGSTAACGNDCNQPWSAQTYDAKGYPNSATDFNGNVFKTTYDANGLLDQRIDASGKPEQRTTNTTWNTSLRVQLARTVLDANGTTVASTSWVYNPSGQPLAQCQVDPAVAAAASYSCAVAGTPPAGVRRWTYAYCTAVDTTQCPIVGLLLTRTGPRTDLTQTTSYAYYLDDTSTHRHGDLKSVTDALGHVTTLASYDGAGRITRTIDPNSTVTDFTYTPRGWLASRIVRFNPDGSADRYNDATTKITYTAYGAVQTVTDADGVKITYGYDTAHRLTTITDALGNVLQYTLDASGNRTAEKTFATGSATPSRTLTRTYNTLGQLTKVIDGLNHTVFDASASGSYDGNGNLVQSSDANGIVHQEGYDALNRLVQSIDNLNGTDTATRNTTTLQGWDALDRLTKLTDPSNLTTTYGYDGLGNLISLSSPDSGSSHASFDAAGNMLSRTDANGITVSYGYDALNRRLSDSYADSTLNTSYHYDDPESAVSCSGASPPANPIGHLTRIVESTVTTTWCYDHNDHLAQQTQLTAGHTDSTEFFISLAGRLGGRIAPDNVGSFYNFDSAGRVVNVTIPPGTLNNGSSPVQQITYLPFGPISSYRLGNGQTVTRSYDANYRLTDLTSPALTLHFALDTMGNTTAIGNAPGANPAAETYGYDPLYRLNTITEAGGTALESYTYNQTGDRLSKTAPGLATGTYLYTTGTHQLASINGIARANDANGNTTGSVIGGNTYGFGYNLRNRMTVAQLNGSTVGTYTYNALGQRIGKVATFPQAVTERYAYDERNDLIGEYGSTNRDYIWLDGIPVAVVDNTINGSVTTSVVNYVTADQLGTPRAVSNGAGTVIWSWAYQGNPFGEQQPTSTTGYVLNLRYPGQYYDAEAGTNYNLSRTYESATGRYLQNDPIGLAGGVSTYAYVNGNPLSYSDPLGLQAGAWPKIPMLPCAGCHSPALPVPPLAVPSPAPGVGHLSNGSQSDASDDAVPETGATPKPGCDDDHMCEIQYALEEQECYSKYEEFGSRARPILSACLDRAKNRWYICLRNHGKMPPDAPGEWMDRDWEGWPTIHDLKAW